MKLVFSKRERTFRRFNKILHAINDKSCVYERMTYPELRACTDTLRKRLHDGESIDDILVDSYALVREVSSRGSYKMRHYDVQLIGAIALHYGMIAEMATGEGKTLVATCPAFLNALSGNSVHIVTPNSYLAERDAEWMGPIYRNLGLSVGCIERKDSSDRGPEYKADIIYGTGTEFCFDYLRNNMKSSLDHLVQGPLDYVIVDDIDSILIDEARTPIIISGPFFGQSPNYVKADHVVRMMRKDKHFEMSSEGVFLTDQGIDRAQELLKVDSLFSGENIRWMHFLQQSLKAHTQHRAEYDYIIKDKKIVLVDGLTGRLMDGRKYSDGLHQAIEAKEGVKISPETKDLANITIQNFFRLYNKIAGMTGTAMSVSNELHKVYGLDTLAIPSNRKLIRQDMQDLIYKTKQEKYAAVLEEIVEVHKEGRPILVGTTSIEKAELLSAFLEQRAIPHEVLHAKHHEREALIIKHAGQMGAVTIAANMAGRGVDIELGEGVKEIGGLHVIGTERHEDRRMDDQLRGRSGRQGDPGSSIFFLSFDDDMMQLFGGEKIPKLLECIGWEEGQAIYHPHISKQIAKTQKKIEERNYEVRKSLLEYDEELDYQRKVFYSRRCGILEGVRLKETISDMIENVINSICDSILTEDYAYRCIIEWACTTFSVDLQFNRIQGKKPDEIENDIKKRAKKRTANEISLSLGEYLEDYEDKRTWNIDALCRWAMSAFGTGLPAGKLKNMEAEEIEQTLIDASADQIDKKDSSQIDDFLKTGFALKTFIQLIQSKFDLRLDYSKLKDLTTVQVREHLSESVAEKYKQHQIEYPVEYAMNMVFTPQGANVYGFEALAKWANKKYNTSLTVESIQNLSQKEVHKKLLNLSTSYNNGQLLEEINAKADSTDTEQLLAWANERFNADLDPSQIEDDADPIEIVTEAGEAFLHEELTGLEKYVLIQIYDAAWKDHLYAMDQLISSIRTISLTGKYAKAEYKREAIRLFKKTLDVIEDRVTSTIFKVDEKRIRPLIELANLYEKTEIWQEAIRCYEKVAEASEKYKAAAWEKIGDIYLDHFDPPETERARQAYETSFQADEKRMSPLFGLVNLYEKTENWQEAIKWYEKVAQISEEHKAAAHGKIVQCLLKDGRASEAEDVASEEDVLVETLDSLASYYEDNGCWQKATYYYREVFKRDNEYINSLISYTKVLTVTDEWSRIKQDDLLDRIDRALKSQKEKLGNTYVRWCAWTAMMRGKYKEALGIILPEFATFTEIDRGRACEVIYICAKITSNEDLLQEIEGEIESCAWPYENRKFLPEFINSLAKQHNNT